MTWCRFRTRCTGGNYHRNEKSIGRLPGLDSAPEFRHGRHPAPGAAIDLRRPACQRGLELQAYLECFQPLFPRRDQGMSFLAYAEGLLSGERRKSVESMVLRQLDGDMNQVHRLQYFAADSP